MSYNCVFILGPTAVGKTAIGVRLAAKFNGEILSADSRMVYRGLDIGSGKDLADYVMTEDFVKSLNPVAPVVLDNDGLYHVPYHIIDVTDLHSEYNLFDFQEDFYKAFTDITSRGRLPVCVGGTGMYLDSILRRYDMVNVPEDKKTYDELNLLSYEQLSDILRAEKKNLHNTTDFGDKDRIIKAIIIERYKKTNEYQKAKEEMAKRPEITPLVIGTTLDRALVRQRIARRLKDRLDEGLIEEVEGLLKQGYSFERLLSLGLEYRFVSEYLQGKIDSKEKLFELLSIAIGQFAKRQETWFRGMEKKGVKINWLSEQMDVEMRYKEALSLVESCF